MALYGPEFAANPGYFYEKLRRECGTIAPVSLAPGIRAMLVLGYEAALEVLRSPDLFRRNAWRWQATVPADGQVLPIMGYQPNCMRTDGAEHARYRSTIIGGLDAVDPVALRAHLESSADVLISRLAPKGHADLITEYAVLMPLMALGHILGCPPTAEERMASAFNTIVHAGHGGDAAEANKEFMRCLLELVRLKREHPGGDATSRMLAHPAGLSDGEVVSQLRFLVAVTTEPEKNLIANTVLLLLSDKRFAGGLSGGSLPVEDALEEVLWTDPPAANFAISYPPRDLDFHGTRLPADQPVVISFAAAHNDPSLPRDRSGNRAHVIWGIGPHACPEQGIGRLIASVALEKLLDGLPELELAVPVEDLRWVPAPFFRSLTALPVRYLPMPLSPRRPSLDPCPAQDPTKLVAASLPSTVSGAGSWWDSLVRWWDGDGSRP